MELLKPLCGAMRKMALICATLAESGTKSTGSAASVAGISPRRRRKHYLVVLVAVILTKFPLVAKEPHLAVASRVVQQITDGNCWFYSDGCGTFWMLYKAQNLLSLLQVLFKVGDTVRILVNFYCWFLIEGESFDKFLKSLLFALSTSKNWTLAKLLTVISKKGASEFCL